MSHTTAINVLLDEQEDIRKNLDQMARSLAGLMARKEIFHVKISDHAILRLRRNMKEHQDRFDDIQRTIKLLEDISKRGSSGIYGFRGYNGEIMSLEGIDFATARDLCEVSGTQLMEKDGDGNWKEA